MDVETIQSALPAVSALVSSNRTRYGLAAACAAGATTKPAIRDATTRAMRRMG